MATVYPAGRPIARTITRGQIGLNTQAYYSQTGEANAVSLLKALGVGAARYPGGSLSDGFNWRNSGQHKNGAWLPEPTTLAAWASVLRQASMDGLFTANYGSNVDYDGVNTPADFAELAQHLAAANLPVGAIELGNEQYGNWETNLGPVADRSPAGYAASAPGMAKAAKSVLPNLGVGAVAMYHGSANTDGAGNPITADDWNSVVLPAVAPHADFAIIHDYVGGITEFPVLAQSIAGIVSTIQSTVADVDRYAGRAMPVWVTETNTNDDADSPQSATAAQALALPEIILLWLVGGAERVYWWDTFVTNANLSPTDEKTAYEQDAGTSGIATLDSDGSTGLFPAGQVLQYLCATILGDRGADVAVWTDTLTKDAVFVARLRPLPDLGAKQYWIVCNNQPFAQIVQVGPSAEAIAGYTAIIYLEERGASPTLTSELTFTHTPYTTGPNPVALPTAYITGVAVDTATNTMTIAGENFGSAAPTTTPTTNGDVSNYSVLTDTTNGNFNYGAPTNSDGLTFSSWSDTQVVLVVPSGDTIPGAGDTMRLYLRNSGGADASSYIPQPCPATPVGYGFPWTTGAH